MYKFNVKLYKNQSDNNVIDKTLINESLIKGISRTEINILQPIINVSNFNVNNYNYCYIEELKRYYYITRFVINPDNTINIYCHIDVLMTYAADIRASSGLITKQRNYNPYYGDFSIEATFQERKYNCENLFTENSEIVLVALRG